MQRQGSKESARLPLAVNSLKCGVANGEGGSPSMGTPRSAHPTISRTPSTTTVTQSRVLGGSSPRQPTSRAFRGSSGSQKRPTVSSRPASTAQDDDEYALGHDGTSDSASEGELPSRSLATARKVALGRKPMFRATSPDADVDDDDEESSGGYLPFAAAPKHTKHDQTATVRDIAGARVGSSHQAAMATATTTTTKGRKKLDAAPPESSASSASSAAQQQGPISVSSSGTFQHRARGPLSPRRHAQLVNANLSPRLRKEGSEGSPSMGSSFSDLDDASITQSALEDALVSNMQAGNLSSIGSRLGSLKEVLGKK